MNARAAHGGDFFHAVGEQFHDLERLRYVVSADVLDAWFDPSPRALEKLRAYLPDLLRTSPPLDAEGLVETIAERRAVPAECVLTGAGSSDLIFTCVPALVRAREPVLLPEPVYGEYPHVLGTLVGAEVHRFVLQAEDAFRFHGAALLETVRRTSSEFTAIVNPNSPTGRLWPKSELLQFLDAVPERVRVMVDETYIDYAGAEHSVESEVANRPNLVVVKSMSKAYALSGLRVGYLVAWPALIEQLRPLMPPWAVSLLAQVAAVEALNDVQYYAERYAETRRFRDELATELESISGLRVYSSEANFLLVECLTADVRSVLATARAQDVFLRDCSTISPRLANFFRVGVKRPEANARIVAAIRDALRAG